jgi:hypothetical protein
VLFLAGHVSVGAQLILPDALLSDLKEHSRGCVASGP